MKFLPAAATGLIAVPLLASCSALENDLQKGLRYGSDSVRLTKKADANRDAGELPKGINAYLWRASMDSIGFLPLESADPDSGKITTQWYSQPAEPGLRSRVMIEILDSDLRRDTVRVTMLRQLQSDDGEWRSVAVPSGAAQSLEDTIYTKARDISPY